MADDLTLELELGRLTISREAVAEIVAETALGCYGVVGLSAGTRVKRLFRREGISVEGDAKALRIELHVVIEHGLNLAEVASTVRSQVGYEVDAADGSRGRGGRGRHPARAGERMRQRVRELVQGARAAIEAHRARIDDLNVYPVPDGDTGTNLTLTVRAISRCSTPTGRRTGRGSRRKSPAPR